MWPRYVFVLQPLRGLVWNSMVSPFRGSRQGPGVEVVDVFHKSLYRILVVLWKKHRLLST